MSMMQLYIRSIAGAWIVRTVDFFNDVFSWHVQHAADNLVYQTHNVDKHDRHGHQQTYQLALGCILQRMYGVW